MVPGASLGPTALSLPGSRPAGGSEPLRVGRDVIAVHILRKLWYTHGMKATIDKAGRVVIPAPVRAKIGLQPGAQFEVLVDEGSIRLVRAVARAKLVRVGKRLVARPTADPKRLPRVDVAKLIEEERNRWPR
jgi:AbrB family looped-hinge helix DNA binding protein